MPGSVAPLRAGAHAATPVRARPSRPAVLRGGVLKLEATSALVADPEAAWARFGETGDGAVLSSIAPDLKLLTPATGEEVTLGNLVGNGKGLVVFMRHIG